MHGIMYKRVTGFIFWKRVFSMIIMFLLIHSSGITQFTTSADFVLGAGFPEWLHTGARFQTGEQHQLGLYFGMYVTYDASPLTISADYCWHFAGDKYTAILKPWYLKGGLYYLDLPDSHTDRTLVYAGGAVGMELYYRDHVGVTAEAGPALRLYSFVNRGPDGKSLLGPVIPVVRLQVFYRTIKHKSWLPRKNKRS